MLEVWFASIGDDENVSLALGIAVGEAIGAAVASAILDRLLLGASRELRLDESTTAAAPATTSTIGWERVERSSFLFAGVVVGSVRARLKAARRLLQLVKFSSGSHVDSLSG
jgi:hypothetical protein